MLQSPSVGFEYGLDESIQNTMRPILHLDQILQFSVMIQRMGTQGDDHRECGKLLCHAKRQRSVVVKEDKSSQRQGQNQNNGTGVV